MEHLLQRAQATQPRGVREEEEGGTQLRGRPEIQLSYPRQRPMYTPVALKHVKHDKISCSTGPSWVVREHLAFLYASRACP